VFNFLKSFANSFTSDRRKATGRRPKARLEIQQLEDRLVPAITDMTQLANLFATPSTPTHLYLNFDGWADNGNSPFLHIFGRTTQDVQDIIYRVSEIFAPFNVQVSEEYGDGAYDSGNGSTTVFVTADGPGGVTPRQYTDYPCVNRGYSHQPNSDPFDLAFVGDYGTNTVDATAISHEAGHTFGLAHVLSSPTPDEMSYDTPLAPRYFADQTFTITDKNGGGVSPNYHPIWQVKDNYITTQNSFTYLEAVLGDRPFDGQFHVVHTASVDPSTRVSLTPLFPNYSLGQTATGNLSHIGDYDVYQMTAPLTETIHIDLTPHNSSLIPYLLVYDGTGNRVAAVDSWLNKGNFEVHTTLSVQAGQTYSFVVGSPGGNSTGGYRFHVYDSSLISLGGSSLGSLVTLITQASPPQGLHLGGGVGAIGSSPASLGTMVAQSRNLPLSLPTGSAGLASPTLPLPSPKDIFVFVPSPGGSVGLADVGMDRYPSGLAGRDFGLSIHGGWDSQIL
jgi:hypothetical protein